MIRVGVNKFMNSFFLIPINGFLSNGKRNFKHLSISHSDAFKLCPLNMYLFYRRDFKSFCAVSSISLIAKYFTLKTLITHNWLIRFRVNRLINIINRVYIRPIGKTFKIWLQKKSNQEPHDLDRIAITTRPSRLERKKKQLKMNKTSK